MAEKSLDTLVEDIYGLFGTDKVEVNPEYIAKFADELSALIAERFHREERETKLRFSNIGRPDRQVWYDINSTGEVEAMLPSTLIKFAYGDVLEHLMLLFARQAGHKVEFEQTEVELEGILGHPDAVIDGVVVDIKSASTFSFAKFADRSLLEPGNDPFGYVGQLAGYVEAINPSGDGAFLAVDKTLGKLCLLQVANEDLKKYRVRDRITYMKEMVQHESPPERCYEPKPDGKSGNLVLPTGCSYCKHKFNCWSDANGGKGLRTFYYSSGPRYFTKIVREPKVIEEF